MTHGADHIFNLMAIAPRHGDGRGRAAPPQSRRFLDIVLWSSLTNLILIACFLAGWNFDAIKARFLPDRVAQALSEGSVDPLAASRRELQDNELLTSGPQRQLKGSLQFTVISSTPPEEPVDMAPAPADDVQSDAIAAADDAPAERDPGDGAGDITVGPEDPAAQLSRSPVLRKAPKSGEVEIGSFTTVSLPGASAECLDTAYGLLDDAGASRDKLKVLAESKLITVARICASNGSLVVTCRSDQITISPRRLKPNESCTG